MAGGSQEAMALCEGLTSRQYTKGPPPCGVLFSEVSGAGSNETPEVRHDATSFL